MRARPKDEQDKLDVLEANTSAYEFTTIEDAEEYIIEVSDDGVYIALHR